jgi:hypothetical protein
MILGCFVRVVSLTPGTRVAGCLLGELHAGCEVEFGVDVPTVAVSVNEERIAIEVYRRAADVPLERAGLSTTPPLGAAALRAAALSSVD